MPITYKFSVRWFSGTLKILEEIKEKLKIIIKIKNKIEN